MIPIYLTQTTHTAYPTHCSIVKYKFEIHRKKSTSLQTIQFFHILQTALHHPSAAGSVETRGNGLGSRDRGGEGRCTGRDRTPHRAAPGAVSAHHRWRNRVGRQGKSDFYSRCCSVLIAVYSVVLDEFLILSCAIHNLVTATVICWTHLPSCSHTQSAAVKARIQVIGLTDVNPNRHSVEAAYRYLVRSHGIIEAAHGASHPSVATGCLAVASVQNILEVRSILFLHGSVVVLAFVFVCALMDPRGAASSF